MRITLYGGWRRTFSSRSGRTIGSGSVVVSLMGPTMSPVGGPGGRRSVRVAGHASGAVEPAVTDQGDVVILGAAGGVPPDRLQNALTDMIGAAGLVRKG